jgi:hypothetical protein
MDSFSTHSIWSILPWDVPWDLGHGFFLGLAYLVLCVIGGTLAIAISRTQKDLEEPH